ncbi:MAG: ubiquitin-specific protease doa4 [Alectoria fallacina]|uniref:Ubiquitin-specific protease doa4 n=1 Tax=Alectoria fallacina TaxID=1903189 RepID=A0A8H3EDV3_9LECA|nr:MAG: ubiquitin-specific protease doa4 [Alectoria fallacina]
MNVTGPLNARFPHIKDLQGKANASVRNIDPRMPIRSLLSRAQQSTVQVGTDVSFKRPDRAYVEYLVSSELLLNIIPKHKDFPTVNSGRGDLKQIYKSLRKQNATQHEMLKQIYNVIVEDNTKSGVRPSDHYLSSRPSSTYSVSSPLSNGHQRPLSMPDTPGTSNRVTDELFLPSSQTMPPISPYQPQPRPSSASRGDRPVVHPKPLGLQAGLNSRDASPHPTSDDALAERFSQLRVQRKNLPVGPADGQRNVSQNGSAEMRSPTNYTPSSSEDSSSSAYIPPQSGGSPSRGKPSGPRDMQLPTFAPPPKLPPPPPKIPLELVTETHLPRAPSPAYNPSKSAVKTNVLTLNRKRSIIGTDPHSPQSVKRFSGQLSSATTYSQSTRSSASYDGVPLAQTLSAELRHKTSISASELYERLQTSSILLIDVRGREEYDQGHIFAKSIMCIEPLGLKSGLSAEELEERLVVSPEVEQSLFERRDDFDLVVYYDRKTSSTGFLTGPPTGTEADAMRALHDTLYEFNAYKPLRRPPIMLEEGLVAWAELVGPQALVTSNTAALVGSRTVSRKPGRPIGRVPKASANSSLEVRKRRLRDQKPLNPDEEKSWLETASREEVDPADYQHAQSDGDADSNSDEPMSPFIHTYEDFLRRFPDVSPMQQSMMVSLPPPSPRSRQSMLPPPPRSLPSVPSRPPPAVPRPSYGGVSERESTQFSPTSRQSSSRQHPLYTSRSISHYLKLPRTGLINFSVTCYMNATIQCLLATIPLSHYFLDNKWKDQTQKNWKGSNGIMPGIYANLIRSLWKDDVQAIRPSSLRSFCARLNKEWGVDRQQDAKEFFDFLVDCLHEDLNENWNRTPLRPLTLREEMDRERMPIQTVSRIEWNRYSHREKSWISDLFAGQHASRLRCTTCQNTSTTYEAFYSISVEIPRTSGKRPWDIHDCLRSYCQEERLSGDEVWKCPHCKCEREATKQITITRAPQFLVVHFKRFEMRKGESARKVHTPIGFPLFGLNMEAYMIPQASKEAHDYSRMDEPIRDAATTPPYLYDAYAVMRHIGNSGNGGHYISLVRDAARGNIWRKFDDERVTDFDPSKLKNDHKLQSEQAYLVFYGRAVAR